MSRNHLYSFVFDDADAITTVYKVSKSGTLKLDDIDSDETYTLLDGYVVKTVVGTSQTTYKIYAEDSTTGYWTEIVQGYGTVDSASLASILAAVSTTAYDGDGQSGDVYSFVLDDTGTSVTSVYEVDRDGSLNQETIDSTETYTVSGDYVVEVETYSYGTEYSVYQLDATTGYYVEVAEGSGTPDLTDIDALVAAYVPDSYTRYTDSDSYKGSKGHDRYDGNSDSNLLLGNAGNDRLKGKGGDDQMHGGRGKDKLFGGSGDDTISGDEGRDMIKGGAGNDSLSGGAGNDALFGQAGDDTLAGDTGSDRLKGGAGNDSLSGGAGNDALFGQAGDDTLAGGTGSDRLKGGAGDDVLDGGDGNDRLWGGTGDDTLTGGAGEDRFIFKSSDGADTVTDFETGVDLLVFGTGVEAAFADLTVTDTGDDALVTYSGGTITLTGVDAALLTADSFDFV